MLAEGCTYKIASNSTAGPRGQPDQFSRADLSSLLWESPQQFNVFISSPLDVVEFRVLLETPGPRPGTTESHIIAQSRIPVSVLSLCLDAPGSSKPQDGRNARPFAIAMDYIPLQGKGVELAEREVVVEDRACLYGYEQLKAGGDDRNLLSKFHADKLILII